MRTQIAALLSFPLVFASLAGCNKPGPCEPAVLPVASRPGTPVATFDGVAISAEEIKGQIEEQAPFVRSRYSSPEGKKEYLDNVVRFELLAREAQKKGYQNDPDVIRQHKRNMVAVFVQKEFEEPQQKQVIPEEDLRKYYDAHQTDYLRPERVRVAQVFFAAPAADKAQRKTQKLAAEAALAAVREKDAKDFVSFGQLAREKSEDAASKAAGGDLQFLPRDQLEKRVGAEVAEAAFGMKDMGKILDRVVESPLGFHLVKLLGRENPLDLKFENVRDSIRSRVIYERRSEAYKKFLEGVNQKAGLKIDTAILEGIKIDLAAPSPNAPGGPGVPGGPGLGLPRAPRPPMPPGAMPPPGVPMPPPAPGR